MPGTLSSIEAEGGRSTLLVGIGKVRPRDERLSVGLVASGDVVFLSYKGINGWGGGTLQDRSGHLVLSRLHLWELCRAVGPRGAWRWGEGRAWFPA